MKNPKKDGHPLEETVSFSIKAAMSPLVKDGVGFGPAMPLVKNVEYLLGATEPSGTVYPLTYDRSHLCLTQKAKGTLSLRRRFGRRATPDTLVWPAAILASPRYVDEAVDFVPGMFWRPCPVRPRHGFVDSRRIDTKEELLALARETFRVDPGAELMCAEALPGVWSAVVTNSSVTVGPGNDSATGGRGGTVSFPVASVYMNNRLREEAGLQDGDAPFYETVDDYIVQLRAGPPTPSHVGEEWVPKPVKVKAVVRGCEDLLAWESIVQKAPEGTMAWLPGASMTSHHAIHCVARDLPVSFAEEPPRMGKRKPTSQRKRWKWAAFRRGVDKGFSLTIPHSYVDRYIAACAFASHHLLVAGRPSDEATEVLGTSLALLIRLGLASSAGECRFHPYGLQNVMPLMMRVEKSGCENYDPDDDGECTSCGKYHGSEKFIRPQRSDIHRAALLPMAADKVFEILVACLATFKEKWSGSAYGGPKWATCTEAMVQLFRAVTAKRLSQKRIIAITNRVAHLCHNGGWYLNKVGNLSRWTRVAEGYPLAIAQAARTLVWIANGAEIELPKKANGTLPDDEGASAVWSGQFRFLGSDAIRVQYKVVEIIRHEKERQIPWYYPVDQDKFDPGMMREYDIALEKATTWRPPEPPVLSSLAGSVKMYWKIPGELLGAVWVDNSTPAPHPEQVKEHIRSEFFSHIIPK